MMSKTFIDFLGELWENELVYVGTKDGSCWLVIETAKTLIENLEKVDSVVRNKTMETCRRAQDRLDTLPRRIVEIQDELKESDDEKRVRWLKADLESLETRYVYAYNVRDKCLKALKKGPIGERKVVEVYEKTAFDPGTAVIIEGFENGDLWLKGEKKVI